MKGMCAGKDKQEAFGWLWFCRSGLHHNDDSLKGIRREMCKWDLYYLQNGIE